MNPTFDHKMAIRLKEGMHDEILDFALYRCIEYDEAARGLLAKGLSTRGRSRRHIGGQGRTIFSNRRRAGFGRTPKPRPHL
jgi:hypothetical protein